MNSKTELQVVRCGTHCLQPFRIEFLVHGISVRGDDATRLLTV